MKHKINIVLKMDIFMKRIHSQLRARSVMAKRITLFLSHPINLGEQLRPSVNAVVGFVILKKLWRHH